MKRSNIYFNYTYFDFSACHFVQCVQFVIVFVTDRNVGQFFWVEYFGRIGTGFFVFARIWIWNSGQHWHWILTSHGIPRINCGTSLSLIGYGILKFGSFTDTWHLVICLIKHSFCLLDLIIWTFEKRSNGIRKYSTLRSTRLEYEKRWKFSRTTNEMSSEHSVLVLVSKWGWLTNRRE